MSLFLLVPLVLVLPGYGWILLWGLNKRFGVIDSLGLSFTISVAFVSLITGGLSLLTTHYLSYSIDSSLGLSLIFLLVSLARHRAPFHPVIRPRFDRYMLLLGGTLCAYAAMLGLLSWSAPFYPTADAVDPVSHIQIVQAIGNGSAKALMLHANYAIGMHFVSAVLGSMLDIDALSAIRLLLILTLADLIFLTYFCARSLLKSAQAASFTVLASAFVIPVDAIHFIKIGTFPNILSDAIVIAMVWLTFSYTREPQRSLGLTLTLLAVAGLFVHSSFLIFLVALWAALPVIFVCQRSYVRNYLEGIVFATAGIFLLLCLLGAFVAGHFDRIFTAYIISSLSPTPVLLIFQTLVWNYSVFAGSLTGLLIAGGIAFILLRQRSAIGPVFLCVWFGLMMAGAVVSTQGWRFVLLSLVPASFILGNLIESLRGLRGEMNWSRGFRLLMPVLLAAMILSGSFVGLLPRVFDPSNRVRQEAIVDSMSWLKQNDLNQSVASVGLWADYRYLEALTGIPYVGDFENVNLTLVGSRDKGFRFVAVAIQGPQLSAFESSVVVQEKYRNGIVAIFFILS